MVKSDILCLPSGFIKRSKLGNPLMSWGISIGIHHRYPLVIKHGWLEHPRTEWRLIAGKITDFKGPSYKSIIILAINLHSVQEFSSHPCLMKPEGIFQHVRHVASLRSERFLQAFELPNGPGGLDNSPDLDSLEDTSGPPDVFGAVFGDDFGRIPSGFIKHGWKIPELNGSF